MLAPVRESLAEDKPIHWQRVNRLPDYVYFDHSIHIAKGVGCTTCHGEVEQMPLMRQAAPLTMGWCLDCHRNPAPNLRPPPRSSTRLAPPADQSERGAKLIAQLSHRHRPPHRLFGVPPVSDASSRRRAHDAGRTRSPRGAEAVRQRRGAGARRLRPAGRGDRALCRACPSGVRPGVPLRFATALPLAGYGRGVIVTSIEGRPIKVEGNPRHPASLGATDVFAEAAVLSLYDPDRSQASARDGEIQPGSAFEARCARDLQRNATRQRRRACACSPAASPRRRCSRRSTTLQARFPKARWHATSRSRTMPCAPARVMAFGQPADGAAALRRCAVVLALDADPLGPGPDQIANRPRLLPSAAQPRSRRISLRLYSVEADLDPDRRTGRPSAGAAAATDPRRRDRDRRARSARRLPRPRAVRRTPIEFAKTAAADLRRAAARALVLVGRAHAAGRARALPLDQRRSSARRSISSRRSIRSRRRQRQRCARWPTTFTAAHVETLIILDANPVYDAPGRSRLRRR